MNLPVKCITCVLKLKLALLLNKGRYVARLELLSITHNITQPEDLSGRLHRQPFELGRSPIGHEIPLQQLPKMDHLHCGQHPTNSTNKSMLRRACAAV